MNFSTGKSLETRIFRILIAVIRKQPAQDRNQAINAMQLLLQMQVIGDSIRENPDKDLSTEELQSFLSGFVAYSKYINELTAQMNDIRDKLTQELKAQGIEL